MTRLGRAPALLAVFAGDYAILMLINGQLTHFDVSASICSVAFLGAALFEDALRLSRKTLADERAAVWDCVALKARHAAARVEQAVAPLKPSAIG
jgi:NhaP-type Na+/H+ or K+/H+ antiporter